MLANATYRMLSSAASDNATVANPTRCELAAIQGYNARASRAYLKLYDKATAPTAADVPKKTIALPAQAAFAVEMAVMFKLGLSYRITAAAADNDATAIAVGDVECLNLDYA